MSVHGGQQGSLSLNGESTSLLERRAKAQDPERASNEDCATVSACDEDVIKAGKTLVSFRLLFRVLALCGLTPTTPNASFFFNYFYPFVCFCMVIVGCVLWQFMLFKYFGMTTFGWSAVALQVVATCNWIFLKFFVGRGGLETLIGGTMFSREYTLAFHRKVRMIVYAGLGLACSSGVVVVILVFYIVPIIFDEGIYTVYHTHAWEMAMWYIFGVVSSVVWTASLFMFFAIYFLVCEMLRHEIGQLIDAVEEHDVDALVLVDWHQGIHKALRETNRSFGFICAGYLFMLLVVILFSTSYLISNAGQAWLSMLISAFFVFLLGVMVAALTVPGAMLTAACRDVVESVSDVVAFCFSHRRFPYGLGARTQSSGALAVPQHKHKQPQTQEEADAEAFELRMAGVTSARLARISSRGNELRLSARALGRVFHGHEYVTSQDKRSEALHLFSAEEEHRKAVDDSWNAENSACVLEYLRAADMSFEIFGMTISYSFVATLAYSFLGLVAVISHISFV